MTASRRTIWARKRAEWARENSAYVHKLLADRHPDFAASLRAAERLVDIEMSGAAAARRS
jgi:hypothetical protein